MLGWDDNDDSDDGMYTSCLDCWCSGRCTVDVVSAGGAHIMSVLSKNMLEERWELKLDEVNGLKPVEVELGISDIVDSE